MSTAAQQGVAAAGSAAVGITPLLTSAAWAVPVVGAAVAGVTLAVQLFMSRKGPRQKQEATLYANQIEALMQENLAAFLGEPTAANRTVALGNFDRLWARLREQCGQAALGDAGRRCISERASGGIYDWRRAYREPIASAALMAPPPASESVFSSGGNGGGGTDLNLLGAVGLAAAAALVWGASS